MDGAKSGALLGTSSNLPFGLNHGNTDEKGYRKVTNIQIVLGKYLFPQLNRML
jgi:hypothetical protein